MNPTPEITNARATTNRGDTTAPAGADSDAGRGEFFGLLLLTLFGMYLMISARHFLLFVIGLECASLPLAAMVAFEKNRYESHEAAIKYILILIVTITGPVTYIPPKADCMPPLNEGQNPPRVKMAKIPRALQRLLSL